MKNRTILHLAICCAVVVALAYWRLNSGVEEKPLDPEGEKPERLALSGVVVCDGELIVGARVRFKGQPKSTQSDERGRFRLGLSDETESDATVTAWKPGYFIGGVSASQDPLQIDLVALPSADHDQYEWVSPHADADATGNCANCHDEIYREWQDGAHAHSASNPRFRNLYDGTVWNGDEKQGWNMLASHPDGAGICSSCHAPSAKIDELAIGDIRNVHGVAADGVHCDFCHKIQNVTTDGSGVTHGRFAMDLLRPKDGQIFFGTLDDVDKGEDTYLPLQAKSEFCSSCHEGVVFGVHVYSTYSEWLASPARRDGKQCQSCHMRPTGMMTNIAPGSGGIARNPQGLASHSLFRGDKAKMLRDSVQTSVSASQSTENVTVDIGITAGNVGHQVPTGFVDRHVLLVVEGFFDQAPVVLSDGPQLDKLAGSFASKPGFLFAKKLIGPGGKTPSPFWIPPDDVIDTRLKPGETSSHRFVFPRATDHVRVRVLYRRFWEKVRRAKQWPDETIVIYDKTVEVETVGKRKEMERMRRTARGSCPV